MEDYYLTYFSKIDDEMRKYLLYAMSYYQDLDKNNSPYNESDRVYISLFLAGINKDLDLYEMFLNKIFRYQVDWNKYYGISDMVEEVSLINRSKYFRAFKSRLAFLCQIPNTLDIINKKLLFKELIIYNLFKEELIHSDVIIKLFKDKYPDYMSNNDYNSAYNIVKVYLAGLVNFKLQKLNIKKEGNEVKSNTLLKYSDNLMQKNYGDRIPAIGREKELEEIKINLLLPEKSLLLVGDAGVGKTSIVYSLAKDIKDGKVPSFLKNLEIIKININSLISGAKYRGEFENRLEEIIKEVKDKDDIILYIEEMHTMAGLGKAEDTGLDKVNILKPYLADGTIRLIGDTTTEEYDKFIKIDGAFDRRFKVIEINEPSKENLIKILNYTLEQLTNRYQINFNFKEEEKNFFWNELINLTTNSYVTNKDGITKAKKNPDLVLDILKLAFAKATYSEKSELTIDDIIYAINANPDINESRKQEKIRNLTKLKRNPSLKLIKTNSFVK